jgi:hypothetical protein
VRGQNQLSDVNYTWPDSPNNKAGPFPSSFSLCCWALTCTGQLPLKNVRRAALTARGAWGSEGRDRSRRDSWRTGTGEGGARVVSRSPRALDERVGGIRNRAFAHPKNRERPCEGCRQQNSRSSGSHFDSPGVAFWQAPFVDTEAINTNPT